MLEIYGSFTVQARVCIEVQIPWSLVRIQVMNTIGNCPLQGSQVLLFACSVSSDENKALEGLKHGGK